MARVTFILGLCGSGKSHLAGTLPGVAVFDEDVAIDRVRRERLLAELRSGRDCAVIDIAYCRAVPRADIQAEIEEGAPGTDIEWICFENDPATANENCRRRTDKGDPERHIEINAWLSPQYTYPAGAAIRKINSL